MHYETINTQAKIAELLHDEGGCRLLPEGSSERDWDRCPYRDAYIAQSAFFLAKLMPTIVEEIVPQVREDERAKVIADAYRARQAAGAGDGEQDATTGGAA